MAALLGVLLIGLGGVLLLTALLSRRGAYAGRALLLLGIGALALCATRDRSSFCLFSGRASDSLMGARRERDALSRSLRAEVLPLIERCNRDLRKCTVALPADEAQVAQRHVLQVLGEAESRRREHEAAIAELDAAIGVMERNNALTRLRPVERGSAMARVTLFDVSPTTKAVSEQ